MEDCSANIMNCYDSPGISSPSILSSNYACLFFDFSSFFQGEVKLDFFLTPQAASLSFFEATAHILGFKLHSGLGLPQH